MTSKCGMAQPSAKATEHPQGDRGRQMLGYMGLSARDYKDHPKEYKQVPTALLPQTPFPSIHFFSLIDQKSEEDTST